MWKLERFGVVGWWCELGHGLELHVAVLELPLVVLLQEDGADKADNGRLVWEDADDVGPPLDLLVQALEGVGAVELGPVLRRKGHVPDCDIKIDGGDQRDITIHPPKTPKIERVAR